MGWFPGGADVCWIFLAGFFYIIKKGALTWED
jgi:NADH:ubiquinone oxidoreductase subunit 3 (subunit A)